MAQREEETELRPHETRVLCVNNCGFPGSPATNNMCQSCFQEAAASSRSCSTGSTPPIRSPDPARPSQEEEEPAAAAAAAAAAAGTAPRSATAVATPPAAREVSRCLVCRKRVRLTGFRCRCGELFCGEHRYSDRHDCSFDYKAAARAAIARANPIVRPSKIARI